MDAADTDGFVTRTLFADDTLLVRQVSRGEGALCYVTFDSYSDFPAGFPLLSRPGFGESYFRPRGIDAIHVMASSNDWYQHDALPDALERIAAATAGCATTIAYGSSMGGYAALTFGAACGARIGFAISPQFSLDPAVVPFEDRWPHDQARIRFRPLPDTPLAHQIIVYDPRDAQDAAHAALFVPRAPTTLVRVPYGGHPAGGYLQETGLLAPLLDLVQAEALEAAAFEREIRARRRLSGQYFFTLAVRHQLKRPRLRTRLAEMAVAANPADANYISHLGTVLDQTRRFPEARAAHERAMAMSDGLHLRHRFANHLAEAGDVAGALAVADGLVRAHPDRGFLREERARLRRWLRNRRWWGPVARALRLDRLLDRWDARRDG